MPEAAVSDRDTRRPCFLTLEKQVLTVSARVVDGEREGFELAWSEYNPTVFRRQFTVSDRVDSDGISAAFMTLT